ncbi:flagellar biosynthetic protein FlhB [Afipia carboxidovorans OM5]|uniref:Flagellar biosynthetic protein FlhB n=1 Tax=Afipia carboxidovorans (strain ATCC 49405 / DSM 1227 / KCTC 32145 / OM5) TaxID=504832 RepID=B6JBJ1_AFIC5|nr:flagellar biosynthesis protein FlhB [Afipia carboxidovorans]ACI92532.1 flagellar biosynthetic protein FlhB [Afipia carboxidovorans OM5]AEI03696.1 flagellar biosynthetic protein FlhB [Afipia carboxidovorans OM4]AEI07273.1 flagellar biosynthetic protein FlhB [Afipia carboxidovorans OM5]
MAEDSDDKTQDPTAKRLEEAHKRGDVAKSIEVNTWFMVAGATFVMSSFSDSVASSITVPLKNLLQHAGEMRVDGASLLQLAARLEIMLLVALGLPFLLLVIAAIASHLVQHRPVWSTDPITPKWSKLSPLAGAKRLFGKQAAANFAKGLFKVITIGVVMAVVMWPEHERADAMVRLDPSLMLDLTRSMALKLMGTVVAMLALVAALDYLFQYRSWFERQKMSLQEVKDEYKQSEGDPQIKGRIRALRMARVRKRMMAAVPTASVVITNPTHYAVALRYERGMPAPICVAKGVDLIAFKIREVATAHDVPIVENVPLARALHASVEIDDEIPVEHYHAVAEVIGYVMRLKRNLRRN